MQGVETTGTAFYGGLVTNTQRVLSFGSGGALGSVNGVNGTYILTNYAISSRQPSLPPLISSVVMAPSGYLDITLADQYPETVSVDSVIVGSVPLQALYPHLQFPMAPLGYSAGLATFATSIGSPPLTPGEQISIIFTDQDNESFETEYSVP